jgi:hypothetical protein
MKIDQTPQVTEEMEYYEIFEKTPEERADIEMMIRPEE